MRNPHVIKRRRLRSTIKFFKLLPRASMEWHYGRLCALLLLSLMLEMPLRTAEYGTIMLGVLFVAIAYSAATAAADTRILRTLYRALVIPFIVIDVQVIIAGAGPALRMAASISHVGLMTFTAMAILVHLKKYNKVSLDTILGGVCVYLLIGETFTYLFSLVEMIQFGSFLEAGHPLQVPPNVHLLLGRRPELAYFSFITLTTVGYGDILPVAPAARILAVLEALIGQIFLATFLAFLVGNYLAQRQDEALARRRSRASPKDEAASPELRGG
jgi:hypothetical protein